MAYQRKQSGKPRRDFIFHTDLAKLGPVRITVDGPIRTVKRKKDNQDCEVVDLTLHHRNGDEERTYWIENDGCGNPFDVPIGETFTIVAEGAKEGATVVKVGTSAENLPDRSQQQPATRTARQTQPAAGAAQQQQARSSAGAGPRIAHPDDAQQDRALGVAKVHVARSSSLMRICLKATSLIAEEWKQLHQDVMPLELFQSINGQLFIDASRSNMGLCLPVRVNYTDLKAVHSEKKQKPVEKPKCPKHGTEMDAGVCVECQKEAAQAAAAPPPEEDDVPF